MDTDYAKWKIDQTVAETCAPNILDPTISSVLEPQT